MLRHKESRHGHPVLEGRNPEGRRLGSVSLRTPCVDRHCVRWGRRGRRRTDQIERIGRIYMDARWTVKGDLYLSTQL